MRNQAVGQGYSTSLDMKAGSTLLGEEQARRGRRW